MIGDNEYRIVSRPCPIWGRRHYPQVRRWWLPIWLDVGRTGYGDIETAVMKAEEHAAEPAEKVEAFLGVFERSGSNGPEGTL